MKLDEIIKQFDEEVKKQEDKAEIFKGDFYKSRRLECIKLADEHRQVAILLRELKAYRDAITEMKKWINSNNRGNADYFIVDKIEEIIEEVNADEDSD